MPGRRRPRPARPASPATAASVVAARSSRPISGRGTLANHTTSPVGSGWAPKNDLRPNTKCHACGVRSSPSRVPRVMPPKLVSPTYRASGAFGSIARRTRERTPSAATSRSPSTTDPSVSTARTPFASSCTDPTSAPSRTSAPWWRAASSSRTASADRFMVSATVPSARGTPSETSPRWRPVAPYIRLTRLGWPIARASSSTPSTSSASRPLGATVTHEPSSGSATGRRSSTVASSPSRVAASATAGPATPPPTTSSLMSGPSVRGSYISIIEG